MRIRRRLKTYLAMAWLGCLMVLAASASWSYDRRTPIVEAVEKVLPAVVNISTTKSVRVQQNPMPFRFNSPFFDFPFSDLFGSKTYQFEGLGSGVIVEGGYVVTNNHVIDYDFGPADKIFITTYGDNKTIEASIVGSDPKEDVAILMVESSDLSHTLPWGRSDDLMIGETVIAVGNALGQSFTVTSGIVSALNRTLEDDSGKSLTNLIQTNADINRGNSGGPLVNINGDFIGLNTAIISPSGGSVGLGLAIPASRVRKIYEYWVHHILALEDQLGLQVQEITPPVDYFFRNEFPALKDQDIQGAVITEVVPQGLAAPQLKRMDIIQAVDGKRIKDRDDFLNRLEEHRGETLVLDLLREGKSEQVHLAVRSQEIITRQWLGMNLQEIDNHWRNRYDLSYNDTGLVIASIRNPEAREAAILPGDIISKIMIENRVYQPRTLADLDKITGATGRNMTLDMELLRQKKTYGRSDSRWRLYQVQLHVTSS